MDWMLFSYIILLHMRFFTFTSEYKGFIIILFIVYHQWCEIHFCLFNKMSIYENIYVSIFIIVTLEKLLEFHVHSEKNVKFYRSFLQTSVEITALYSCKNRMSRKHLLIFIKTQKKRILFFNYSSNLIKSTQSVTIQRHCLLFWECNKHANFTMWRDNSEFYEVQSRTELCQ